MTDTPGAGYSGYLGGHGNGRGPPFVFNSSQNALEDSLGLVAALVVSRINATVPVAVEAAVKVTVTRIGNGKLVALGCAVPSLLASLVLLYQIAGTWKMGRAKHSTANLTDLIDMGEASAKSGGVLGPEYLWENGNTTNMSLIRS